MDKSAIPNSLRGFYKKWLRYYLDFCEKYHLPPAEKQSLPRFIQKLQAKKQTREQQGQAAAAIKLYYEILPVRSSSAVEPLNQPPGPQGFAGFHAEERYFIREHSQRPIQYEKGKPPVSPDSPLSAPACRISQAAGPMMEKKRAEPGTGASWKAKYGRLAEEIKFRHYSSKTLQTYRGWLQHFQTFLRSKAPEALSADDVKEFLTSLAVKRKVSSTTQNQAFNALLFFYRHVLKKEFGKIDGVVRAKRKPYIPVVLSREEIDAVLKHLEPPYDLLQFCLPSAAGQL